MVKKQLIMEKSLELFAKQGFEATSVQQITEQCGISKGAFYLAFKSKGELILAMIDHFMMEILSEIDRIVRTNVKKEELLYKFFYATFYAFHKHSDFAKILIKEQTQTFNEDFMVKMHYYDKLNENIILSLIERLYGEDVQNTKYDLMYCIKGFLNTYSQLFIFYNVPIDLDLLSRSLEEKTNVLARNMTLSFISEELVQIIQNPMDENITKEKLLELIEPKIDEMEESIEKESLVLLREELVVPALSPALVKGLLENLRNHPDCKWISYQLRRYYQF